MRKISLIAMSICIFFILTFSSLFSIMYNLDYYERKYEKYNIYDRFSKGEARNATKNMFGFFNSENNLDMKFFNEREKSHLQDVKSLIIKAKSVYYTNIALFWIILLTYYLFNKKDLVKIFSESLFYGGILTLSVLVFFGLIFWITGFDFLFLKFHHLFFTGNYSFNPQISNMKALFPDAFFFDISLRIIFSIILKAILVTFTGYVLRKTKSKPLRN